MSVEDSDLVEVTKDEMWLSVRSVLPLVGASETHRFYLLGECSRIGCDRCSSGGKDVPVIWLVGCRELSRDKEDHSMVAVGICQCTDGVWVSVRDETGLYDKAMFGHKKGLVIIAKELSFTELQIFTKKLVTLAFDFLKSLPEVETNELN